MIGVILNAPPDFVLIGGTPAEKELKDLAEFAAKEENHWNAAEGKAHEPNPFTRHVKVSCTSGHDHTVHVIFTFSVGFLMKPTGEVVKKVVIRHLTLGMDDFMAHPDPVQILTVAKFLGFTGSNENWHIEMHPSWTNVVVVTQPVETDAFAGRKVEQQMFFMKGGVKKEEFWPTQDLANDPKGQEQSTNLVRAVRLRRALEKTGMAANSTKALMDIWFNKPLKNSEPVEVNLLTTVPLDLTEEEKEVFKELRQRVLGY